MRKVHLVFLLLCAIVQLNAQTKSAFGTADYIRALKHATDIMVNDVTNPVAASRYYAYITLAANEAVCQFNKTQPRPVANADSYAAPQIDAAVIGKSDPGLAVVLSVYEASVRFLPSGPTLRKNVDSLLKIAAKRKVPAASVNATVDMVKEIIRSTAAYSAQDGFSKLSGLKRFTPAVGDEYWQPTSPGFMSAIEPYWHTIRPFIIDSASRFVIDPPTKYDTARGSAFYSQMMEVYNVGKNLSQEQIVIASFWDCNPFALQQIGHLEFGIKKLSPGGHWIGITGIACKKAKTGLSQTAYVHALLSATMADAFIVCWKTKYHYNRVRPETAIKRLVDRSWNPFLQTPPFPEYTSGHSVVSSACAKVLTAVFGDNFSYVDDTEKEFGLPARKFSSFEQAAAEAAVSRLYGGIHYRDAIDSGQKEGARIGEYVMSKVGGNGMHTSLLNTLPAKYNR